MLLTGKVCLGNFIDPQSSQADKMGSINVKARNKADCRVFSLDGRNGADFTLCPRNQNRSAAKPFLFRDFFF